MDAFEEFAVGIGRWRTINGKQVFIQEQQPVVLLDYPWIVTLADPADADEAKEWCRTSGLHGTSGVHYQDGHEIRYWIGVMDERDAVLLKLRWHNGDNEWVDYTKEGA